MIRHLTRSRLCAQMVLVLTLALCLSVFALPSATAHAAVAQTVPVTIHGQVYRITPGTTLKFPFTYHDGTHGWVLYTFTDAPARAATPQPASINCKTANSSQWFTNVYGGVLAKFNMSQYWCYNGTQVTVNPPNRPTYSYSTGYGWSLYGANALNYGLYGYPPSTAYEAWGSFRFNGPFGIGCVSGDNFIDFYGSGSYHVSYDQASQYGC